MKSIIRWILGFTVVNFAAAFSIVCFLPPCFEWGPIFCYIGASIINIIFFAGFFTAIFNYTGAKD